jgi:hypothetical protein
MGHPVPHAQIAESDDADGLDGYVFPVDETAPYYVRNDAEFRAAVEIGIREADAGLLIPHDEVVALLERIIPAPR